MTTINLKDQSGTVSLDNNNGSVSVSKNSKVLWIAGSGIKSMVITPVIKTGDIDIWSTAPHKLAGSENWRGTTGNTDGQEYYKVDYVLDNDQTGSIDPVITVSPRNI